MTESRDTNPRQEAAEGSVRPDQTAVDRQPEEKDSRTEKRSPLWNNENINQKMLKRSIVSGLIILFLEICLFLRRKDNVLIVLCPICWGGAMINCFRYFVKYDQLFHPKDWHDGIPHHVKGQPVLNVLALNVLKWALLALLAGFGSMMMDTL